MKSILLPMLVLAACGADDPRPAPAPAATHSSAIALSPAGDRLFVVDPDGDAVAILDPAARARVASIALGAPAIDPATHAYTPSVMPRALAVSPDGATLYVTGQRANALFAIDVAAQAVRGQVAVGSEPVGVVVGPDGAVYVACSQDAEVVRIDPAALAVTGTVAVAREPWALAWSDTGALLVSHLLTPAITPIDPAAFTAGPAWPIPDAPRRADDARLPHGQPRGFYDLAPRPGTPELWIAHVLLGTDTPQPQLDFESTVFPALALVGDDGTYRRTLSVDVADLPGADGSFGDVVSGPHALAFTADGAYALVVDTDSEDVLAVDAETEAEAALLRPLPGHLPDGIVLSGDDRTAYVNERNSGDVAIVTLDRAAGGLALSVDDTPIVYRAADAMPRDLRLGQQLFYSANSDDFPITQNHWVACASCHLEGRSDAVTWLFAQGPRDTPTNAGGMLGTGFLFRTADRQNVQDYWITVNVEQGGKFSSDTSAPYLDALEAYVDRAIPAPIPPTTDPALVARGKTVFEDPAVGCATCHSGPRFTDSGAGNATLDLAGTVLLHDVGTCNTSDTFPDVAHEDRDGHARAACRFDTPSLTGLASSPPYLHDGRAATIEDVLAQTRGTMGHTEQLSDADRAALVEYLRSL